MKQIRYTDTTGSENSSIVEWDVSEIKDGQGIESDLSRLSTSFKSSLTGGRHQETAPRRKSVASQVLAADKLVIQKHADSTGMNYLRPFD